MDFLKHKRRALELEPQANSRWLHGLGSQFSIQKPPHIPDSQPSIQNPPHIPGSQSSIQNPPPNLSPQLNTHTPLPDLNSQPSMQKPPHCLASHTNVQGTNITSTEIESTPGLTTDKTATWSDSEHLTLPIRNWVSQSQSANKRRRIDKEAVKLALDDFLEDKVD
jgi:hypothetical protein